jgi:hypothetical protein
MRRAPSVIKSFGCRWSQFSACLKLPRLPSNSTTALRFCQPNQPNVLIRFFDVVRPRTTGNYRSHKWRRRVGSSSSRIRLPSSIFEQRRFEIHAIAVPAQGEINGIARRGICKDDVVVPSYFLKRFSRLIIAGARLAVQ